MSKLFGVETSFTNHRGIAIPGQISDTHMYIINGTHAFIADEHHPAPYRSNGRAVYLDEEYMLHPDDSGEVAMLVADGQVPFGVLVNSQSQSPKGGYDSGSPANVITYGRVWMVASSLINWDEVVYGRRVYIRKGYASAVTGDLVEGGVRTRWYFTGSYHKNAFINEFGDSRDIVEVMIVPGGAPGKRQPKPPAILDDTGFGLTNTQTGKSVTRDRERIVVKAGGRMKIELSDKKWKKDFGADLKEGERVAEVRAYTTVWTGSDVAGKEKTYVINKDYVKVGGEGEPEFYSAEMVIDYEKRDPGVARGGPFDIDFAYRIRLADGNIVDRRPKNGNTVKIYAFEKGDSPD